MDLKKQLHAILLRSPKNLFDDFIKECQEWYSQPAHSLQEMRVRDNKKVRGDIFEDFCALYLKNVKGFDEVWLLDDIPEEILKFNAIYDMILVERINAPEKTDFGLFLPKVEGCIIYF